MPYTLNIPYFIISVQDHQTLKPQILSAIDNMCVNSVDGYNEKIYNTDWYLPESVSRPYMEYMNGCYTDSIDKISDHLGFKVVPENVWFQQYIHGDFHNWHTHHCIYNGIYYVELADECARTTVRIGKEEIDIEVKEGDILLLPGGIMHCSKQNRSNERKTVIAFNLALTLEEHVKQ